MVGQNQPESAIRLSMELTNKVYGVYAWNKITTLFRNKEEVEDYLKLCGNITSCYNPPYDKWTTDHDFSIIPVDKEAMRLLGLTYYYPEKV